VYTCNIVFKHFAGSPHTLGTGAQVTKIPSTKYTSLEKQNREHKKEEEYYDLFKIILYIKF
jgi:hypothetical protein